MARLPAPEQPEGVPVPPNERVWLHDGEDRTPLDEPGEHDECQTSRVAGSTRLHLTFEIQRQLLAEEEVLGGQARVGPEAEPSEVQKVGQEIEDGVNCH